MNNENNRALEVLSEKITTLDLKLGKKTEELEEYLANDKYRWCRHEALPDQQALPVPRLECEYIEGDYESVWIYRLVYRFYLGQIIGVPLGCTKTSGGMRQAGDLPFRDGAHLRYDSATLRLPAYSIIPGFAPVLIEPVTAERLAEIERLPKA